MIRSVDPDGTFEREKILASHRTEHLAYTPSYTLATITQSRGHHTHALPPTGRPRPPQARLVSRVGRDNRIQKVHRALIALHPQKEGGHLRRLEYAAEFVSNAL